MPARDCRPKLPFGPDGPREDNLPGRMAAGQTMVKSLGVAYFCPDQAIFADQWDGQCSQCDLAHFK